MQAEPAPAHASAAALGAFALLQSHDALAAAALPALVAGAGVALYRGELDFARASAAPQWAFAALLLAWCLSIAFAPQPRVGIALSVPALAAAIALLIAARARWSPAARRVVFASVCCAAGLQCVQVLLALATGATAGAPAVAAATVPWLVAPNDLAWCACLLAFLPGLWVRAPGPAARIACAGFAALVFGAAIAAESRLALACGLLALGVPLLRKRGWIALLLGAGMAAVLGLAWGKGLASLGSRAELWAAAIDLGAAHPWTGVGPGGFMNALEQAMPAQTRVDPRGMPWPHSLPLEAFAVLGLPGAAALVAIAATCMRRANLRDSAALGMIAAAGLLVLLEASLLRTWLWFMLALLCGLPARADLPQATDGSG